MVLCIAGTPSPDEMWFVTNEAAASAIAELGKCPKRDLATLFPGVAPAAVSLLTGLLQFDPRRRLTIDAAISHAYLAEYHAWEGAVEPVWPHRPIQFEFDAIRLNKQDIQV